MSMFIQKKQLKIISDIIVYKQAIEEKIITNILRD